MGENPDDGTYRGRQVLVVDQPDRVELALTLVRAHGFGQHPLAHKHHFYTFRSSSAAVHPKRSPYEPARRKQLPSGKKPESSTHPRLCWGRFSEQPGMTSGSKGAGMLNCYGMLAIPH